MSTPERSMRTPLGRVRHHGAGARGHRPFHRHARHLDRARDPRALVRRQRRALDPRRRAISATIDFISNPVNAVGVILLVAVGLYHMSLGMQEVILDYILKPFTKIVLLFLNALVPLGAGRRRDLRRAAREFRSLIRWPLTLGSITPSTSLLSAPAAPGSAPRSAARKRA